MSSCFCFFAQMELAELFMKKNERKKKVVYAHPSTMLTFLFVCYSCCCYAVDALVVVCEKIQREPSLRLQIDNL